MRAIAILATASMFLGAGAALGQELISKEEIKASLLGPTRAIGKKQRTAVDLPTVTFDFNSAALTRQGEQQLDILASAVKEVGLSQQVLTIEGHTDASGGEAYNQNLSERRAATVKNYLASKGVPAGIINASGRGESQPVADNKTAAGRAQNRRVEITVDVTQ